MGCCAGSDISVGVCMKCGERVISRKDNSFPLLKVNFLISEREAVVFFCNG